MLQARGRSPEMGESGVAAPDAKCHPSVRNDIDGRDRRRSGCRKSRHRVRDRCRQTDLLGGGGGQCQTNERVAPKVLGIGDRQTIPSLRLDVLRRCGDLVGCRAELCLKFHCACPLLRLTGSRFVEPIRFRRKRRSSSSRDSMLVTGLPFCSCLKLRRHRSDPPFFSRSHRNEAQDLRRN